MMPGNLPDRVIWSFVLLLSLLIQTSVPIASDEAYFIAWGQSLAPGLYDHPPLPGWISWLLWQVGELFGLARQGVLHRIFSLGLGGLSLWLVARRLHQMPDLDSPGALLVLLALVPGYLVLFNMYLNDTILVFATLAFLLSVEAAYRAERRVVLPVLLAGLSFAAILLTKYNGALIFIGLVGALATWREGRRFLFGPMIVISLIAGLPFLAHLWWNWNNCSVNLAFNFVFRNAAAPGNGPLWFALSLLLMAGPVGFYAFYRAVRLPDAPGFFTRVFLVSLLVMLLISIWRREFGTNWGAPLGFLALLALAELGNTGTSLWLRRAGVGLAAVILLPVTLFLLGLKAGVLDVRDYVSTKRAHALELRLDLASGALPDLLRPLAQGRRLAVMEYGIGAGFDAAGFERSVVISKSVFGRNQDIFVDFRALDGQDMLLLPNEALADPAMAARLFDSFEIRRVDARFGSYQIILGQGFDYQAYREDWILPVITRLYDKSPVSAVRCFIDKYR